MIAQKGQISLREAFGNALVELAGKRKDFVVFDADVYGGTGTKSFREKFSDRFFQFGISEQNMVAAAAGFSTSGIIPIVTTFSVFGVCRSHEQFRTQVCYPSRKVILACSHVGLDTGPDGPTAQMLEDLATVRAIPNLTVLVPADGPEVHAALEAALDCAGPVYMRTGRSAAPIYHDRVPEFKIGSAEVLADGRDVTIIAVGVMVYRALVAADMLAKQGVKAAVINLRSLKPIDSATILKFAEKTGVIVTAEDHNRIGGLYSSVAEVVCQSNSARVECVAVNDVFGESGEPQQLAVKYGLDPEGIIKAVQRGLKTKAVKI